MSSSMLCNSRRCSTINQDSCFYKSRSETLAFDQARYAECDKISRRLINKSGHTIYNQATYLIYKKQRLELHNIQLDIRGARDTDIELMNYTREEVISIARGII